MKYMVFDKHLDAVAEDGLYDNKDDAILYIKGEVDSGTAAAEDYVVYEIAAVYTYVPPKGKGSLVQTESFR